MERHESAKLQACLRYLSAVLSSSAKNILGLGVYNGFVFEMTFHQKICSDHKFLLVVRELINRRTRQIKKKVADTITFEIDNHKVFSRNSLENVS